MLTFNDDPPEVARGIAERVRLRRLELDLTQQSMARRAGMSLSTYRRFEATGEITMHNLILIGVVLGATEDFSGLFQQPRYASLDDVIRPRRPRQRGSRND